MTSPIRRIAGVMTVAEGGWLLYSYFTAPAAGVCTGGACGSPVMYLWAALPLGAILLAAGGLGIWGASFAYFGGALFSGIVLVALGYEVYSSGGMVYLGAYTNSTEVSFALAIVAMLGNVVAMRARGGISEQVHPMNLPVFG